LTNLWRMKNIFAALSLLVLTSSAVAEIGTIQRVIGAATFATSSKTGRVSPYMPLLQNTAISTPAGSTVDILMKHCGSAIRIEPNSEVLFHQKRFTHLGRGEHETRIEIRRGHLVGNLYKKTSNRSRFEIRSVTGRTRIGGTVFRIGASGVQIVSGNAEVVLKNGKKHTVGGGEKIDADNGNKKRKTKLPENQVVAGHATASTMHAGISKAEFNRTVHELCTAIAAHHTSAMGETPAAHAEHAAKIAKSVATYLQQQVKRESDAAKGGHQHANECVNHMQANFHEITSKAAAHAACLAVISAGGSDQDAHQAASAAARNASSQAKAHKQALEHVKKLLPAARKGHTDGNSLSKNVEESTAGKSDE
jgi:hypothetical protein